jgi:putative IMPACT (imprinted ancient) family translation regulator
MTIVPLINRFKKGSYDIGEHQGTNSVGMHMLKIHMM